MKESTRYLMETSRMALMGFLANPNTATSAPYAELAANAWTAAQAMANAAPADVKADFLGLPWANVYPNLMSMVATWVQNEFLPAAQSGTPTGDTGILMAKLAEHLPKVGAVMGPWTMLVENEANFTLGYAPWTTDTTFWLRTIAGVINVQFMSAQGRVTVRAGA
jgi:hypothetical protein